MQPSLNLLYQSLTVLFTYNTTITNIPQLTINLAALCHYGCRKQKNIIHITLAGRAITDQSIWSVSQSIHVLSVVTRDEHRQKTIDVYIVKSLSLINL